MATGTKAPALPTIKRRVRGGVPVYVVDGPAPARCALMFRVGRSDETLVTGGVTHLIEHLALFPVGDQPYDYNGFVEPHRTVFHAAGRPEECIEFLATVTASLADLPMHRLEHEHRVLSAETDGRGGSLFDALVTYRFGPRGLGLVGYPQFGAQAMTPPQVDAWRAGWFTAANAALVVSGVPVESLRLALPAGTRRTAVAAPSIEPDLPAWFPSSGGGLGVSMVAERDPALAAGLRIAEKRLQRRLRTDMAVVYHVGASTQYLDARTLHVVIGCDPVADHAAAAFDAMVEELDRLAADGPDPAELEADRSLLQRDWDDPNVGYAIADLLATDELLGAERRTPAAIVRGVRSVTVEGVARALAEARRSALWAVPRNVPPPEPSRLRPVSLSSVFRADGRRLPPADSGDHPRDERLVVGDRGVGLDCGDDWHVHVAYDQCAAMLSWRDGARLLYGDDGFVVRIKPWEWVDGAKAVAEVDAHLDPSLVVDMGEGDGPPPPPEPVAVPPAARTAEWRQLKRVGAMVALALAAILALVMAFTGPTLDPADVKGVPREAVPVGEDGYVACGASTLTVVRQGVPSSGPSTPVVVTACEKEARFQLSVAGVCLLVSVAGTGWLLRRRIGAR